MITYNTLFRLASSLAITALLVPASYAETITMEYAPEPIVGDPPVHPEPLLKRELPGEAVLEFTIDEEGNVKEVEVKSATNVGFAHAARSAIQKWKYEPMRKNGRPVSVRAIQRFVFRISS